MEVLLDTCGRRRVKPLLLLYLLVVPLVNAAGQSNHQPCSLMIEITVFISLPTGELQPEQLGCVLCSYFGRIIHYLVSVATIFLLFVTKLVEQILIHHFLSNALSEP